MKKSLLRQIYPIYLVIILSSIAAVSIYATGTFRSFFFRQTEQDLIESTRMISRLVPAELLERLEDPAAIEEIQSFVHALVDGTDNRLTLILPDGTVTGDTHADPRRMLNHLGRPEIEGALAQQEGKSTRYSATLAERMMYYAVPLPADGSIRAVLRLATPVDIIDRKLREVSGKILLSGLLILSATALISFVVARRINRPLLVMEQAAVRYARGELDFRFAVSRPEELKSLADSMNTMAGQLKERIAVIERQRNELETILSSMVEAVMVLDSGMRVRTVNRAARRLFRLPATVPESRSVLEVVRNTELQALAEEVLRSGEAIERSIVLFDEAVLHLQVHGTLIASEPGGSSGVLLVMNDITRLKQLENIRKDFVANVSHELRTPITSIKGFVETLREGALGDTERALHFLGIIEKHTNRLNAIIEDLLSLSRLEQNELNSFQLSDSSISAIIADAVQVCTSQAEAKGIDIRIDIDSDADRAEVNPLLLEQAVINLVDNAVKYSEPGAGVDIALKAGGEDVLLSVRDEGSGIPAVELPRIFERFYRVDKARSRSMGGTGLGLAIVKHIVLAHRGEILVESEPGAGSTFTIRLPRKRRADRQDPLPDAGDRIDENRRTASTETESGLDSEVRPR